jgi:hypothetical protein
VAEFGAKVHRVLNDPGYRSSARRVAESMRQFGGAQKAADCIEQLAAVRSEPPKMMLTLAQVSCRREVVLQQREQQCKGYLCPRYRIDLLKLRKR